MAQAHKRIKLHYASTQSRRLSEQLMDVASRAERWADMPETGVSDIRRLMDDVRVVQEQLLQVNTHLVSALIHAADGAPALDSPSGNQSSRVPRREQEV